MFVVLECVLVRDRVVHWSVSLNGNVCWGESSCSGESVWLSGVCFGTAMCVVNSSVFLGGSMCWKRKCLLELSLFCRSSVYYGRSVCWSASVFFGWTVYWRGFVCYRGSVCWSALVCSGVRLC